LREHEYKTCQEFILDMGQNCKNCGKFMKNPDITHCSDECLLDLIKDSNSVTKNKVDAASWSEKSDPWI
jgi:hypothetical protein